MMQRIQQPLTRSHGRASIRQILALLMVAILTTKTDAAAWTTTINADNEPVNFFDFWKLDSSPGQLTTAWDTLRTPLEEPLPTPKGTLELGAGPDSPKTANDPDSFVELLNRQGTGTRLPDLSSRGSSVPSLAPGRLTLTQSANADILKVQSKLEVPDGHELSAIPYIGRDWKTDQTVNVPIPVALPVAESMFLYGQVGSNGDATNNQTTKLSGKTGIGWKWSPVNGYEFQIRGGRSVAYADIYLPTRFQERSQVSVELQAKFTVIGPFQLQYIGEALPAMTQADREQVKQDLKLALPFGVGNELYVGAKYRWDGPGPTLPTPWIDRAQIYFGLQFKH